MGANSEDIEIDYGNLFEQIEDIIEFPPEDSGNHSVMSCNDGKDVLSLCNNVLPECHHPLFPDYYNAGLQLSLPYEDIAQLEWLSAFVEDSFSGGGSTLGNKQFCSNKGVQISSPISVLESSSSSSSSCCSGEKIPTTTPTTTTLSPARHGLQRARSKRPRPAVFNPTRPEIRLISEKFVGFPKPAKVESNKKMKTKTRVDDESPSPLPERKCLHCEITKTPQWRAGPMGPKTLCNACGVRYKSGRLFPEYRPAASPTFVPSVHSNSHKKVLEMRTNVNAN